jgi:hypothetical protein
LKRRQTSILNQDGTVTVWNDGAKSDASKRDYASLDDWLTRTGKTVTPDQKEEIRRITNV